jgi:hypothetical protein
MPPMTFSAKMCLLVCALSVFMLYGSGHPFLFGLSILNVAIYFWSLGVMDNFARDKYRELGIHEIKYLPDWMNEASHKRAMDTVPNWLAVMNMVSVFLGVGLLVYGIVINIKTEV